MKFFEDSNNLYVAVEDLLERHSELERKVIEGHGTSYHSSETAWWDLKRELKEKLEELSV